MRRRGSRSWSGRSGNCAGPTRDPQVGRSFLRGGARPPTDTVIAYIDAHRHEFGVEPICRVWQVAPSTYYAAKTRPPSARTMRDEQLKEQIVRVFEANYRCYRVHKVWRQVNRVARCTVQR